METSYLCPDCGDEHDEPGEANLGLKVRCLDCQIEVDLAFELRMMPQPRIAA
jgi:DNA-directed RNA polymerase subunit RPC12/RpoP